MIRYAQLNITVDKTNLQKDVLPLVNQTWQPHYNLRDYEGDWNVLALRSPGGNSNHAYAESFNEKAFADTEIMDRCPAIKSLLNSLACEKLSARLLNLKQGATIKLHRDRELAFENGEARLHFPVFTNPQVAFQLDGHLLKMEPGECWYINANLPHSVANNGATDRIHLVVDCLVNPWLQDLFSRSASSTSFVNEKELKARLYEQNIPVIQELPRQNTAQSTLLANEMEAQLL